MAPDHTQNRCSKTNSPRPNNRIVKAHTFHLLRWCVAAVAIFWLMTALSANPVQATAPQPFSQSPLTTPVQRRSQQLVPSPTPSVTAEPYQVSPLRIDDAERPLLGNAAALWIGAAGIMLLGGSIVLVLARRR